MHACQVEQLPTDLRCSQAEEIGYRSRRLVPKCARQPYEGALKNIRALFSGLEETNPNLVRDRTLAGDNVKTRWVEKLTLAIRLLRAGLGWAMT